MSRSQQWWDTPGKLVLALLYALAFEHSYASFISPVYEYSHYYYFPAPLPLSIATYFLVILPCLFSRWTEAPSALGISLFYALCYVPTQLIMLFNWNRGAAELLVVQASLAASMSIFMACGAAGWRPAVEAVPLKRLGPVMMVMTAFSLILLVWTYRDHMRFVGFDAVYDLRFETNEIEAGVIVDYFVSWLSYCFLPFYLARGIWNKRVMDIVVALTAALLLYTSSGAKAMILMAPIMLILHWLMNARERFLPALLALLTVAVVFVTDYMSSDGIGYWVKFVFLLRTLCAGGWASFVYYDYFTQNGLTYYSHIGVVNKLTDAYPYGKYSLGQVIGVEYSGSDLANFNANFWASDGFAALGLAGIPVVTAVALIVYFAINRISSGYSPRFVGLWLTGFWLGLLNLPLPTSLVSAGGALTLLLLWYAARAKPSSVAAR